MLTQKLNKEDLVPRQVRSCLVVVDSLSYQISLKGPVLSLLKKLIVSKNGSSDEDEIVFRLNININN